MNVWNTQGGSPFRYVYGGTASDTVNAYDNRNVLFFRNASNGSTIATTYSWWDSSNRLLDSDIIVWDGGFTFYTGTSGCGAVSNSAYLEDIATHELGHALGLNHSAAGDATMYPSYGFCSQEMRTLSSDDIAAIQSLYGSTGGSSSNTAPTVTITSPANGGTVSLGTGDHPGRQCVGYPGWQSLSERSVDRQWCRRWNGCVAASHAERHRCAHVRGEGH
jgi:hypothetical protein